MPLRSAINTFVYREPCLMSKTKALLCFVLCILCANGVIFVLLFFSPLIFIALPKVRSCQEILVLLIVPQ